MPISTFSLHPCSSQRPPVTLKNPAHNSSHVLMEKDGRGIKASFLFIQKKVHQPTHQRNSHFPTTQAFMCFRNPTSLSFLIREVELPQKIASKTGSALKGLQGVRSSQKIRDKCHEAGEEDTGRG